MANSFYSSEELQELGLAAVGTNVLISRKASIYGGSHISIGSNVRIDDFCILSGKITIGSYIHISAYTGIFAGDSGVTIHDYTTISGRCNIYGKTDDYSGEAMTNPMVPEAYIQVTDAPVIFEKHSIIGCGSTILPGVTIAEGTSVGCMSLVKKNTKPWIMYAGIPAKELRKRNQKPLELEKLFEEETRRTQCPK